MKRTVKSILICLLAAIMVLPIVACTQDSKTDNKLRYAIDNENGTYINLFVASLIDPDETYGSEPDFVGPGDDMDIDMSIDMIDIAGDLCKESFKDGLANISKLSETVNSLSDALKEREQFGYKLYSSAVRGIASAAATYLLQKGVSVLLNAFGVDTRSDEEKILDKLEMLDDMAEQIDRIKDKVEELSTTIKNQKAQSLMDDRNDKLYALELVTSSSYKAVINYLSSGYDEYMATYERLQTLLDTANYTGDNPLVTEQYFMSVASELDADFMNTYLYMQNHAGSTAGRRNNFTDNSLALYMGYRLEQIDLDSDDTITKAFLKVVYDWGKTDVMGNVSTVTTQLLMKRFAGGYAVLDSSNMTFPEIYDYVVNAQNAWEHEGYALREALRSQDACIIDEAYYMAQLYNTIYGNELNRDENSAMLDKLMTDYKAVMDSHPVVRNEDYYICIVPGCEYVFAKNLIFYDYYSGLNTVKDIQVFNNDQEPLRAEANTAYNNLFYSSAITYDYYKLSDSDKSKLTFDHSTIGAADNPIASVNTADVAKLGTAIGKTYLSIDAYKALLKFYQNKYEMPELTLKQVIEAVFDVTLPDNAYIVADPDSVNLSKVGQYDLGFSEDIYYVGPFKMKIANQSCDGDDIAVRSVIKWDATGTDETRFVNDCNIKAGNGKITAMGSPVFRFFGLETLAYAG